jgi:UDP-N-acetyl-D-glucosamine dehydrogenase
MGQLFYSQALQKVVGVSSTQVAETVKLLENTFRMINIGLANEMALMCDRMGINVWEVIDAAVSSLSVLCRSTQGRVGRPLHSDRSILSSWKTRQAGIEARFIELAGYINGQMPLFVVDKVQNALNDAAKQVKGSRIHILGVAYKRDIADWRESPAVEIMHLLERRDAEVSYSDPYVPVVSLDGQHWVSYDFARGVEEADCVVIATDHGSFDYQFVVERAKLIVDTRNALKGMTSEKFVRL